MDINTCFATTETYHTIANYSHLVPVSIAVILGIFALVASRFSFLSKILAIFIVSFCLWLVGDLVVWTGRDYNLVNFMWAPLDYINVIFYLLGAYFFTVLVSEGKKIPTWLKFLFLTLSVPAWWITVSGQSITGFNQPQCEAFNSELLTNYKLVIEWLVCAYILIITIISTRKVERNKKNQYWIVSLALLLFFGVFSVTEYISSQNGIYEINLYSLFILPVFLGLIIYSITNLKMFQLRLVDAQLIVYVLLIMVGSQFFFLENVTDKVLTIVTLAISAFLAITLLRNIKKEAEARKKIEELAASLQSANTRLREQDIQKTEFISFATHQLRSPLTSIKGNTSLILEGDAGPVPEQMKGIIEIIYTSIKTMGNIVEDYLNMSRLELGTMKYNLIEMDFKDLVHDVMNEQKINIESKALTYSISVDEALTYKIKADPDKFKQIIMNVVDNSVKYTPKGSLSISLTKNPAHNAILFSVSDTGVGIKPEVIPKLFRKFSRAPDASVSNIHGTGLGLYIAKEFIAAHKGRIWAESQGEGKGSQFYVEVPEVK